MIPKALEKTSLPTMSPAHVDHPSAGISDYVNAMYIWRIKATTRLGERQ